MPHVELVENEEKCTGCGICELACSFYHGGICAPSLSAIRLMREDQKWYRFEISSPCHISICRQCPSPAPCEEACPVEGALVRKADTGAIVVDYSSCTVCEQCIESCPYNGIWYNSRAQKIVICDLCGGHPECINWCPKGVLRCVVDKEGD